MTIQITKPGDAEGPKQLVGSRTSNADARGDAAFSRD